MGKLTDYKKSTEVKRMITEMRKAHIRFSEITTAIGCSRWMVYLWLEREHIPSDESFERVDAAYKKLAPKDRVDSYEIICALKNRHGWTSAMLAEAIGCDPMTVNNWFRNGRRPNAKYRSKLSDVYHQIADVR